MCCDSSSEGDLPAFWIRSHHGNQPFLFEMMVGRQDFRDTAFVADILILGTFDPSITQFA